MAKPTLPTLPIDAELPGLLRRLADCPNLVLVAEPGAGKTTRVPPALLGADWLGDGEVWVLEPRRIAARMAARRVASELGEPVGKRVGYQVRFERKVSRDTRVTFVTEALLTRRLLDDPDLKGIGAVVLDEFHERSIHTDLALALLKRLQARRPELRIVVMSATLDADSVARYLDDCPALHVSGRTFPVEVEFLERPDERPLQAQVAVGVRKLCVRGLDGDTLVFLPGAAEIRRASEACEPLVQQFGVELCVLHGDLPPDQQDRALREGKRPKVILSTNIAETSLTLPGVTSVIDSGLVRSAGHSPWSGLPTLTTKPISQASATQRAGRAGRVREGRCLRLYTQGDYHGRPAQDTPEVRRSDLAETALVLHAALGAEPLPWFEPPPSAAWEAAESLLSDLGAVADEGGLNDCGRALLAMGVHPRAGRLFQVAAEQGCAHEGAIAAALLGERDLRLDQRRMGAGRDDEVGNSDLWARLLAFESLGGDTSARGARRSGLDAQVVRVVDRTAQQLLRRAGRGPAPGSDAESVLTVATLMAFPDRVARRRKPRGDTVVLAGGGSARLAPASVVKEAELLVAVEADERPGGAIVRTACAIEPELLLEHFPQHIHDARKLRFDRDAERIEVREQLLYRTLVLDESIKLGEQAEDVAQALADAALAAGAAAPWDVDAVEQLRRRLKFAAEHIPDVKPFDEAAFLDVLRQHCLDKTSFAELRAAPLQTLLPHLLDPATARALQEQAPVEVRLASGRRLKVTYEPDRPPWVKSRLQDFFGCQDGPRVADGRVPLVLHLLAPNQRPVQVSTDLAGFWERHYPTLRKELGRRYPRHSWPEDPLTAEPPKPRPPRRRK